MEEEGSNKIERKSSIDSEPKTLNVYQIGYAREAALCVFNTSSVEEASDIFTEGLEPVVGLVMRKDEKCKIMDLDHHKKGLVWWRNRLRNVASATF